MNLIIIVSDTFRWDYIGAYNNDWIQTPYLDKLASESAIFMDAYAEGMPTLPARRVIKTGRPVFPFTYRPQFSDDIQIEGWHPLYDEDVTIAEQLRKFDYYSCFITDVPHMMKPGKNFHRGYDNWYWIRGQEEDPYALLDPGRVRELLIEAGYDFGTYPKRHWVVQHLMNRKDWKGEKDSFAAKVMMQASSWLEDYTLDNPFFMYVDCFDPHEPWDPPIEYANIYDTEFSGLNGYLIPRSTSEMTEQQFRNVKTAYAAEVTLVDRWIGHFLDSIRKKGVLGDTLIVFTSDHGCMMGEQGEVHKGTNRLRNQCTHVPLLIRHPKKEAAGKMICGFVQHQDIMPTCLKLIDVDVPKRVLGRNIWQQTVGDGEPPEFVVSGFGNYACIRTEKWNYLQPWKDLIDGQTERFELYDLEHDPKELTNVLNEHRDVGRILAAELEAYIRDKAALTGGSFQGTAETHAGMSIDALPPLYRR